MKFSLDWKLEPAFPKWPGGTQPTLQDDQEGTSERFKLVIFRNH